MSEHLDDDALADLSLVGDAGGPEHDHLRACPTCSARLASFGRVVLAARPDATAEPLQPPPHLWARIAQEAGVPADPLAPSRPGPRAEPSRVEGLPPRAPGRARRLPVLLAAAATAGLLLGSGLTWSAVGGGPARGARVLAEASLRPLAGSDGSGRAEVDRTGDDRRLVVDAALPAADRQYYEVWLIDPDDGGLVSLGVLPGGDDAPLRLVLPADVDLGAYRTVDVSLEDADGDPGHSGDSVLRGTLVPRT